MIKLTFPYRIGLILIYHFQCFPCFFKIISIPHRSDFNVVWDVLSGEDKIFPYRIGLILIISRVFKVADKEVSEFPYRIGLILIGIRNQIQVKISTYISIPHRSDFNYCYLQDL